MLYSNIGTGVDLARIFVISFRARKARQGLEGTGAMLPQEILKSRVDLWNAISCTLGQDLEGIFWSENDKYVCLHLQFVEKLTLTWLFKITQTHLTCIWDRNSLSSLEPFFPHSILKQTHGKQKAPSTYFEYASQGKRTNYSGLNLRSFHQFPKRQGTHNLRQPSKCFG